MSKLKIAFLWHQHQPYYRYQNEFILPWVRMHGVKDYFDLPEVLYEFPEIKQTFNFAPSLYKQINQYVSGEFTDKIQRLTMLKAESLSNEQKHEILEHFFKCRKETMIDIHPRYKELYDKSHDSDYAVNNFSVQDWLDLQIWYNLTWIGYFSSKSNPIKRLLNKAKYFTEEEKEVLLEYHLEILKSIIPQMIKLVKLGQVEISVSPAYHPILPLLIDSESAKESMPGAAMPSPLFRWKEDASEQIEKGINSFKEVFSFSPNGMWPSEGSVSDDTLKLIADKGIKWIATDEEILFKSKQVSNLEKYFPFQYNSDNNSLTVFFRDHYLSDKIGFEYANWRAEDAANDFIHYLQNIRTEILNNYGESGLDKAVVSVILDGENCWEFYKDNGIPFLRELYRRLSENDDLETVKFSDVLDNDYNSLSHIFSGSWINADFKIWIGDHEDISAWELLSKTREFYENNKTSIDNELLEEIKEHLFAAEGSDWFWWYGPEHHTEDKDKFDKIFRWHLKRIYELFEIPVPAEIEKSILTNTKQSELDYPTGMIKPKITGNTSSPGWDNAGVYTPKQDNSAMHKISTDISKVLYGTDYDYIYFRILLNKTLSEKDSIIINFIGNTNLSLKIKQTGYELNNNSSLPLKYMAFTSIDCYDFKIDLKSLGFYDNRKDKIEIQFGLNSEGDIKYYPADKSLILKF